MKNQVTIWHAFFILACIHTSCSLITAPQSHHPFVSNQCLDAQRTLLLQFRATLTFNSSISTKLVQWNQTTTDCCRWSGVECHLSTRQVIGLDLSEEGISSGIDNPSSLFRLQSLESLNLAYNDEILGNIPSALSNLSSLTYLNLSNTGFTGQVPFEISRLTNLFILDISIFNHQLYIKNPDLSILIQNLTNLRELYLDGVNIISVQPIPLVLPQLKVLSMSFCNLTAEIYHSLATLQSLSKIYLNENNFSTPLPDFFAGFKNLTVLSLWRCGLIGTIPTSIGNLNQLENIDLSSNNFFASTIPTSIKNIFNKLDNFDHNFNNFSGTIPSFSSIKTLTDLRLASNSLSGSITTTDWGGLINLTILDLSYNSLTGSIPTSLFSIPSLTFLDLSNNKFSGQLYEFANPPSMLSYPILGNNNLEGAVHIFVSQLKSLQILDLSWNKFNGTLRLNEILHSLGKLIRLTLSYNYLSIDENDSIANSSFPQLNSLGLASCNLHVLPHFLKYQTNLLELDLSNNHIQGKVPAWIWKVFNIDDRWYKNFNLSFNGFVDFEQPLSPVSSFYLLDLHSNNLQGQFPGIPLSSIQYMDYSNNNFTSINPDTGNSLSQSTFLSLSRNNIHGEIPTSFCSATELTVLDLANNHLNGAIPDCLIRMTQNLRILNLRRNNLHGAIPDKFGSDCKLESFKANMNFLHGWIPRSLANCQGLSTLDLGDNELNDTFPSHLGNLSGLQILILRSNRLQGDVVCSEIMDWSLLQIVDLSSNHFTGQLSTLFLGKWEKMMAESDVTQPNLRYLGYSNPSFINNYNEEVTLTFKGSTFMLEKVLTIFTTIDLSNNSFVGTIPKELWNMVALKVLDLSHNSLSGNIVASIGNLSQLESLDLSRNALSGNIPPQLAKLNFLEYLNLSFNKLTGLIPTGTQLQSFNRSSYEGNPGLYGPPLTQIGKHRHAPDSMSQTPPNPNGSQWRFKDELEWMLRGAEVGYPVGITLFIGPLLYIKRWRQWYYYHVDRLLMKVFARKDSRWQKRKMTSRRQRKQRR